MLFYAVREKTKGGRGMEGGLSRGLLNEEETADRVGKMLQ